MDIEKPKFELARLEAEAFDSSERIVRKIPQLELKLDRNDGG